MTEKTTDLIISKLLDASSIEHYAESCPIEEINKAMVSKRGTGKKGFPEYLAISGDFVIVIEDKAKVEDQAKYLKDNETLLMDTSSVTKYAENGALHYALSIIQNTNFKKVIAFGCSGTDEKRIVIRPIYVSPTGYKILPKVKDFSQFSTENIERYYNEIICGNESIERVELKTILSRAKTLHEDLRYFAEYLHSNILTAICNNSPEDVLGRFYGEFISYSGGDGQTLGVVLTPKHITELFTELAEIKPTDKVLDPCCGTGGFLIAAMHRMLTQAKEEDEENIRRNNLHGIELRDDMFSIATTNMILRGDGKSNLICADFLKQKSEDMYKKGFTVGLMNPPYSQGKTKSTAHLTELKFICHLLDCVGDGARCVVIVPQSTMVGKTKEDKIDKQYILDNHTLEGVITLNTDTFYGVGTNPVIAVFTAHQPHPKDKLVKFVDFKDDGYEVFAHVGLMPTDRAAERKKYLLDCWFQGKTAPNSFIVRSTIEADDEWLHSFYYFNEEIPSEEDFEKTMADYLTFEFNMITHGRGYLFEEKEVANG